MATTGQFSWPSAGRFHVRPRAVPTVPWHSSRLPSTWPSPRARKGRAGRDPLQSRAGLCTPHMPDGHWSSSAPVLLLRHDEHLGSRRYLPRLRHSCPPGCWRPRGRVRARVPMPTARRSSTD